MRSIRSSTFDAERTLINNSYSHAESKPFSDRFRFAIPIDLLRLLLLRLHATHIRLRSTDRIRWRLLQDLLLPRHPSQPIQKERGRDIENDVRPHDPEVSPPRRILRTQLREIRVCAVCSAELAVGGGVHVGDVAAVDGVDVGLHVGAAGGAGGRVEGDELNGGAFDGVVGEAGGEHSVDEVGEGGDAVHEDPEARKGAGAGEDTAGIGQYDSSCVGSLRESLPAEDQSQGKEELCDIPRCFGGFDTSNNHVCEGGCE